MSASPSLKQLDCGVYSLITFSNKTYSDFSISKIALGDLSL